MKPVATKYYKISVTMKTGFKYSVFCASRQLEGMKKSSDGYWTEKMEVTEATEEEHRKWWWGENEENEKSTVKQSTRKRKTARKEN